MSEFSESYHLETDRQQAGIHLLQRANLDGVVFPPRHGWVTILPRSKFGCGRIHDPASKCHADKPAAQSAARGGRQPRHR